jgi:hypothetical protein
MNSSFNLREGISPFFANRSTKLRGSLQRLANCAIVRCWGMRNEFRLGICRPGRHANPESLAACPPMSRGPNNKFSARTLRRPSRTFLTKYLGTFVAGFRIYPITFLPLPHVDRVDASINLTTDAYFTIDTTQLIRPVVAVQDFSDIPAGVSFRQEPMLGESPSVDSQIPAYPVQVFVQR